MARIYDFPSGEILEDLPTREPLLKNIIGKSIGRFSLSLTQESVRSREDRINDAIKLGLAAFQARHDYMTPRSDMTQLEVLQLNDRAAVALADLNPAERREAAEYIASLTGKSEQEIS